MRRSVQLYFPPEDFEFYRQALDSLAGDLVTDEEAGQRGAKASIFIRMLLTAYIQDGQTTVAELQKVKEIAMTRNRAQEAQEAAEHNARARSGAYSATKIAIEELSDDELREAVSWPRFVEDWKQKLIEQERRRRSV